MLLKTILLMQEMSMLTTQLMLLMKTMLKLLVTMSVLVEI